MNTSETLLAGSAENLLDFMMARRKPLSVSQSDDVNWCIETVTGHLINPSNPAAEAVCLTDIAWALSRIPRFAGHTITETAYNVAQHSIYVSELVENFLIHSSGMPECAANTVTRGKIKETLLHALLHDAHEAYIGDIPSPIKRIPELHETYKIMEMRLDHVIRLYFNLDEPDEDQKSLIKHCDKLAQAIEGYQFMPSRGLSWNLPKPEISQLQQFPAPLGPLASYKSFLDRLEYLQAQ